MKYRIYMFSSETERLAALDDTRNTGLKYAKEMKGENGCDVEIVYEFFPKPGGGISVDLSQVMGCTIPEDENKEECKKKSRAIADSTSAYISNCCAGKAINAQRVTIPSRSTKLRPGNKFHHNKDVDSIHLRGHWGTNQYYLSQNVASGQS